MRYQATQSFEGVLTMKDGEIRELCDDMLIVKDLVTAGFIKQIKSKKDEGDN